MINKILEVNFADRIKFHNKIDRRRLPWHSRIMGKINIVKVSETFIYIVLVLYCQFRTRQFSSVLYCTVQYRAGQKKIKSCHKSKILILHIPVTPPYHVKFSHQIIVFTVKFDFVDLQRNYFFFFEIWRWSTFHNTILGFFKKKPINILFFLFYLLLFIFFYNSMLKPSQNSKLFLIMKHNETFQIYAQSCDLASV